MTDNAGWILITSDSRQTLVNLARLRVGEHFTREIPPADLTGYLVRNKEGVLEIKKEDETQGYAFVGCYGSQGDIEGVLKKFRKQYEKEGKLTERLFLDLREGHRDVGLEWRRK
jgi:hypothetical protein